MLFEKENCSSEEDKMTEDGSVWREKIYINSRNLTITETHILLLACNAIVKIMFGVGAELEVKEIPLV